MRKRPQDHAKDGVELFPDVFGQKPQREVAVFLQKHNFPPVAAVGFRVLRMLKSVQFYCQTASAGSELVVVFGLVFRRGRERRSRSTEKVNYQAP